MHQFILLVQLYAYKFSLDIGGALSDLRNVIVYMRDCIMNVIFCKPVLISYFISNLANLYILGNRNK